MLSTFTASFSFGRNPSSLYVPSIVSDNLYFEVDASNSNSYPGSGITWYNLLNGIVFTINGAGWSSTDGGTFEFDGVNDFTYPNILDTTLQLKTTPQTLQVWVKFNSFGSYNPIFNHFSSVNIPYTPSDGYALHVQSDRTIASYTNGSSGVRLVSSTSTVSANQWYLITYVFQASSVANTTRVYVNTTEYISTSHGSDTVSTSQGQGLFIAYNGQPGGSGKYSNCLIGAIYAYTDALTAEEVEFNYNTTKSRYVPAGIVTSGLQFNLETAPISGTTWTDSSGNGRNATLLGSPSYVSNNGGGIRLNNENSNGTDYISVPYNIASNTVTIEVVASFNPTSFWGAIWGNEIYDTSGGYLAYMDNSTNLYYGSPNGEVPVTITESNAIRHWIFVINGTHISLFLNGSQVGTTDTIGNQTLFATNDFYFGARHNNNGIGFGGDAMNNSNSALYPVFYQMRAYNRALSGAEITQNYNAVKDTYGI